MEIKRGRLATLGLALGMLVPPALAAPAAPTIAPYTHIFLIIEENHTYDQIIGNKAAPNFNRLAKLYGIATNFYAERHPSEPNYIAMLGGDTFGIADDDAYWCKRGQTQARGCDNVNAKEYVDHTIAARSLMDQLEERHLTWKGYFEDLPGAGAGDDRWPSPQAPARDKPHSLYAVKHNGFMFFKHVQDDPARAQKIVGFDQLERDLLSGALPNYAHIVPNQCNDMHGLHGANVPGDCMKSEDDKLIGASDAHMAALVAKIMGAKFWANQQENNAIVVTFDENDAGRPDSHGDGCCGSLAGDRNNPGGGWIPTIVISNHGVRSVTDDMPHNHYSLLRTTQEAFGIKEYLGHAGDEAKGVHSMTKLFAVKTR